LAANQRRGLLCRSRKRRLTRLQHTSGLDLRKAEFQRLNFNLIENRELRKDSWMIGWARNSSVRPLSTSDLAAPDQFNGITVMLDRAPFTTPTTLPEKAVRDISRALMPLLCDVFALYLKTKNFHWHMSGPHFRDYHLMLDDQGDQLFAMTDAIAERARKLGGATVRSIGQISRFQRIADNDAEYVEPLDMIAELRDDHVTLTKNMREVHLLCDEADDVATASLLENWIDETEKRVWFLFECGRHA
jgi:starvation-inducible DNA-binding protein